MKRVLALSVKGRRRRGRPRLRWEDCLKRDLAEVGGEWRTRVRDRGSGENSETGLVMEKKKVEDQYQCQPHPGFQRQSGEQQL